jgi:rsbT co-antagonist protein RsbR
MTTTRTNHAYEILRTHEKELLAEWQREVGAAGLTGHDRTADAELHGQMQELLRVLQRTSAGGGLGSGDDEELRRFLAELSGARIARGFRAEQTATLVFSLKKPLFARLRRDLAGQPDALAEQLWLVDRLGLLTIAEFQRTREEIIVRQQHELLELSTPVVKLWDGVLALPMIGTLDSSRAQVVMESLLQAIVTSGSEIAIVDITGVPTVDTLVAQHLLKTVTAIRLMGADCIISGVRPQIAQTIVQLGVDLQGVTTKATLADALALALKRTGFTVARKA